MATSTFQSFQVVFLVLLTWSRALVEVSRSYGWNLRNVRNFFSFRRQLRVSYWAVAVSDRHQVFCFEKKHNLPFVGNGTSMVSFFCHMSGFGISLTNIISIILSQSHFFNTYHKEQYFVHIFRRKERNHCDIFFRDVQVKNYNFCLKSEEVNMNILNYMPRGCEYCSEIIAVWEL